MGAFEIKIDTEEKCAGLLSDYSKTVTAAANQVAEVRKALGSINHNGSFSVVAGKLLASTVAIDTHAGKVSSLSSTLTNVAKTYRVYDNKAAGKSFKNWTIGLLHGEVLKDEFLSKEVTGSILHWDFGDGSIVDILKGTASGSLFQIGGPAVSKWKKLAEHERGKTLYDHQTVTDPDGQMSIPELTKYGKKNSTVGEVTLAEGSLEGSLAEYKKEGKYGSVTAKVGNAQVNGSVKAGLYGYTKDGKQVFAPEVAATVGASACVLTVGAEGSIGSDMLGASAEGEVSVGKVEAEATARAALFGKNGELNPELQAKASAEAIAAEAKGSASIKVAGVEGKVNGSVNFGVGAHADIGIVDGKVKCDIGASLGVGASIGFEIDTKPLVKAVSSGAKAVWKAFRW